MRNYIRFNNSDFGIRIILSSIVSVRFACKMVSNYKRKTKRGSYSKEKLDEAVRAVKYGNLSGYKASQVYQIPRMTIMDRVNNRRTKSNSLGRNTALIPEVEEKLANCLRLMERYGFGLSRKEVLEMVGEYVQQNNISTSFKNGIPGQAWFSAFKERHNLSIKKPQAIEYARKKAIDPFIVYPYFELLKNTLLQLNLIDKPSAIWNLDETSFSKDPEKTKIVGAKGHVAIRVIASPGKDNTTVLLAANALGEKAPPMIVYKGKNVWDSWISSDAYPGTSYAATTNGWMESKVFEMYFKKTFLPAIGNQRPVLLIYDGHATHVGLNIIEEARKANVTILKLPAHTSHILQPLDVSVMKSFKDRWDLLLVKWQRLNVGIPLPKKEFACLIGKVWAQIDGLILKNGFRKAGIFPFNPEEIRQDIFDSLKIKQWRELQVVKPQNTPQNTVRLVVDNDAGTVAKHSPKSLLSLALDCIYKGLVSPLEEEKNYHQVQVNEPFLAINQESTVIQERTEKKIQILENKVVTFEELLLFKVKAGISEKVKRRKIAPGAEVITHDDVLKRKIQEKIINVKIEPHEKNIKTKIQKSKISVQAKKTNAIKNKKKKYEKAPLSDSKYDYESDNDSNFVTSDLPMISEVQAESSTTTKKGKGIGKKSRDSEKENIDKNITKPKVKKRARIISPDSTSVSDCVSICSDSDDVDWDKDNDVEDIKMASSIDTVEMENKNKEVEEIYNSSHRENEQTKEGSKRQDKENKKREQAWWSETENDGDSENFNINVNDHVMVRYYNRKKWTYYVGCVEGIKANKEETYSVRFYKTIKNPLKFVLAKKVDHDDVPTLSIVKKVDLRQAPNNHKEFVLSNCEDNIYFS